jgi:hypothetical protein
MRAVKHATRPATIALDGGIGADEGGLCAPYGGAGVFNLSSV